MGGNKREEIGPIWRKSAITVCPWVALASSYCSHCSEGDSLLHRLSVVASLQQNQASQGLWPEIPGTEIPHKSSLLLFMAGILVIAIKSNPYNTHGRFVAISLSLRFCPDLTFQLLLGMATSEWSRTTIDTELWLSNLGQMRVFWSRQTDHLLSQATDHAHLPSQGPLSHQHFVLSFS